MFKFNERYLLSLGNKDMGKVKIFGIVKKNQRIKKRIHRIKKSFDVINVNIK